MASDVYLIKVSGTDSDETMAGKLNNLLDASGVLRFLKKDDRTGLKIHFGEAGKRRKK